MPNWCTNDVILRHKDPAMIQRAVKAYQEGRLLDEFIPCPQTLRDTVAGFLGEDQRTEHEAQQARNIAEHGYKDWYDWCVANWGTKWDIGGNSEFADQPDPNTLELKFDSAWSPPIEAYRALEEEGFEVEAYYNEPGIGFFGSYANGYEDTIDYTDMSAETVRKEFPDLDLRFGVSDWLEECQADREEQEEE